MMMVSRWRQSLQIEESYLPETCPFLCKCPTVLCVGSAVELRATAVPGPADGFLVALIVAPSAPASPASVSPASCFMLADTVANNNNGNHNHNMDDNNSIGCTSSDDGEPGLLSSLSAAATAPSPADSTIALQLRPRLDGGGSVVCSAGRLPQGVEESVIRLASSPFAVNRSFSLIFLVQQDCYQIIINGEHVMDFCHRVRAESVTHLLLDGDAIFEHVAFYSPGAVAASSPHGHPQAITPTPSCPNKNTKTAKLKNSNGNNKSDKAAVVAAKSLLRQQADERHHSSAPPLMVTNDGNNDRVDDNDDVDDDVFDKQESNNKKIANSNQKTNNNCHHRSASDSSVKVVRATNNSSNLRSTSLSANQKGDDSGKKRLMSSSSSSKYSSSSDDEKLVVVKDAKPSNNAPTQKRLFVKGSQRQQQSMKHGTASLMAESKALRTLRPSPTGIITHHQCKQIAATQ